MLESIQPGARITFGLCALALLALILVMIRRNAIKEKYVLLWLPLGIGFLAMSVFPEVLLGFSARVHLHYMTVVMLGVILVFTNILLYFTVRMSQMREDIKKLSQAIALLQVQQQRPVSQPAPDKPDGNAGDGWVARPAESDVPRRSAT